MRILKTVLIIVLPALLAGYVAWLVIPCQPERGIRLPVGTKLLEFSAAGRYAVTFQREQGRLTLWRADTGKLAYETEVPCVIAPNSSTNGVRAFYGFSSDDGLLAVTTGTPDQPHLAIIDLQSGNDEMQSIDLPANPDGYRPRPAFSYDGRYLSYFSQEGPGKDCAVLYDLIDKLEHLRVPGASDKLGMPTPEGTWFLADSDYEIWNIHKKQRDCGLRRNTLAPLWPKCDMLHADMAPDGQALFAMHVVESASPRHGFFFYRFDLSSRTSKSEWQYVLHPSALPFWNLGSSDPMQYLLIKNLDDQGDLVQDLLEVDSGKVLFRYSPPITMLEDIAYTYEGQRTDYGAGLTQSLGRTGEIVIDADRQVLGSKHLIRETLWWRHLGGPLRWLGAKRPSPSLHLQFHSAQTGKLLEQVPIHTPYRAFDPVLAMHPKEPLLTVIDEKESQAHLQFWRVPPPKPWGWIIVSALAGGVVALLVRLVFEKLARKTALFKKA